MESAQCRGVKAKSPDQEYLIGALHKNSAVTYSPTREPLQYHRRSVVSLLCSEWERVDPLRYDRRKVFCRRQAAAAFRYGEGR